MCFRYMFFIKNTSVERDEIFKNRFITVLVVILWILAKLFIFQKLLLIVTFEINFSRNIDFE